MNWSGTLTPGDVPVTFQDETWEVWSNTDLTKLVGQKVTVTITKTGGNEGYSGKLKKYSKHYIVTA